MKKQVIKIKEVLKVSPDHVILSSHSGELLRAHIEPYIPQGVILDFEGIRQISHSFAYNAVAMLYPTFTIDQIKNIELLAKPSIKNWFNRMMQVRINQINKELIDG